MLGRRSFRLFWGAQNWPIFRRKLLVYWWLVSTEAVGFQKVLSVALFRIWFGVRTLDSTPMLNIRIYVFTSLEINLHIPHAQCMVYLPTFAPKTVQMWVDRPYVEHLGICCVCLRTPVLCQLFIKKSSAGQRSLQTHNHRKSLGSCRLKGYGVSWVVEVAERVCVSMLFWIPNLSTFKRQHWAVFVYSRCYRFSMFFFRSLEIGNIWRFPEACGGWPVFGKTVPNPSEPAFLEIFPIASMYEILYMYISYTYIYISYIFIHLLTFTHRRLRVPQRRNAPPATEAQPNGTHSSFRVPNFSFWFGLQIIGCTFKHILHSTFRVFKLRDWFGAPSCF